MPDYCFIWLHSHQSNLIILPVWSCMRASRLFNNEGIVVPSCLSANSLTRSAKLQQKSCSYWEYELWPNSFQLLMVSTSTAMSHHNHSCCLLIRPNCRLTLRFSTVSCLLPWPSLTLGAEANSPTFSIPSQIWCKARQQLWWNSLQFFPFYHFGCGFPSLLSSPQQQNEAEDLVTF